MTKEFVISKKKPTPLDEQETIITYDKALKEWHIYTDNPSHARKYEHTVAISDVYPNAKTYHIESGELIGLEGKIEGSVSIRKKTEMSIEQKRAFRNRMTVNKQTESILS